MPQQELHVDNMGPNAICLSSRSQLHGRGGAALEFLRRRCTSMLVLLAVTCTIFLSQQRDAEVQAALRWRLAFASRIEVQFQV